jgi:hypothetical protein
VGNGSADTAVDVDQHDTTCRVVRDVYYHGVDRVTSGSRARQWLRRNLRTLLLLVLVLVVALGGYVGYAVIRAAQPVALATPTGPYPVGRSIVEWTDRSRTDPLAPRPTNRELSI